MGNFFAVFAVLLIVGYVFLFVGGELGLVLFAVAAVAFLVAMLINQNEKLDALRKQVAELRARLDGADKPTEESSGGPQ